MCVRMCMCVCVRACVSTRAHMHVYVRLCLCVHTFLALVSIRNAVIEVNAFRAINLPQTKVGAEGNHWASLLGKYPSPDGGQCNGNNDTRSIKQNSDLPSLACLKSLFL